MSEALLIEKWANIPGHPRYMASNLGRIRNSETKHVLKPRVNKNNNYLEVSLHDKGRKPKHYTIHRLIAKTFLACIDERYFVNHIDSNRHNNKITNLEWCTPSENALHMSKQGRANGGLSRVSYNRYSLQGEFIERYNSTKELEAAGFHCEALREAIKNRKGIYKGFMWNKTRTEVKAVAQYDIKGKLLHIYRGGASEAAKENDYCQISINKAARGERNTYKGYIWKYHDAHHARDVGQCVGTDEDCGVELETPWW